jgi:hypothetical protein
LVRRENHTGRSYIHAAPRARVIENAECEYPFRKLIFVKFLRTDQLTGLAGREWIGSRIELRKRKKPAKFSRFAVGSGLALRALSEG